MNNKPIVVGFIGGPGIGKSIITSDIFVKLKHEFISTEISPEYIKKKIREGSKKAIESQIYIFGKQQFQLYTLKDEVDVIVTDSPLLHSAIYDNTECPYLKGLIFKEYNKYHNLLYFIERNEDVPYEQEGRYQDEDGAKKVDDRVRIFLDNHSIEYTVVTGIGEDTVNLVISDIKKELDARKKS